MELFISNIKYLLQAGEDISCRKGKEMNHLPVLENAWLHVLDGIIRGYGTGETRDSYMGSSVSDNTMYIDATGKTVMPAFCDSHTHIVYAGSRELEFVDRLKGLSYEEIAARGGGILNSSRKMQDITEEDLYEQSLDRAFEIISLGTGAVEIKSGYGLTTGSELKMLRVIRKIKENSRLTVKSTFLGAHAIPMEYRENPDEYVDIVINEMIPAVTAEDLADYIDVFCDKGFFTPEQTERILMAGIKHGLRPKIHANELGFTGGVQVGVKYDAASVDHLEYMDKDELESLQDSETIAGLLPGASFFLNMPYAPAREIIDSGIPVALASDYNPGSAPSGNMQFIASLGCIQLKMLPAEVMNAVTINGACAMGVDDELGSISVGKKANLIITRHIPSWEFIPYAFGSNLVDMVVLNGLIQSV
ncbi:MAG: imidazolonepropionase [Bacteroidales bacterium]